MPEEIRRILRSESGDKSIYFHDGHQSKLVSSHIENGLLYIESLNVSEKFQRKGLGRELINHLVNEARAKNIKAIVVDSTRESRPFFIKNGFRMLDSLHEYRLIRLT